MHLHSTGGLGLNDADVSKVTKVVLHAPLNIDTLAKQLAVFATLCGAIFREKSELQVEMDDWIMHITNSKQPIRICKILDPFLPYYNLPVSLTRRSSFTWAIVLMLNPPMTCHHHVFLSHEPSSL
jgi:hypothetical protein